MLHTFTGDTGLRGPTGEVGIPGTKENKGNLNVWIAN